MRRGQKHVSLSVDLGNINLGKLGGKDSEGDVRNKLGNTQTRLSASERAEEVAATLHSKDKDAKREEEVAALMSYAKAGRARLHESLISFGAEASDGFSQADQALFVNPLGVVDHIQSVQQQRSGRHSPPHQHHALASVTSLSPKIGPLSAGGGVGAQSPPPVTQEASLGSRTPTLGGTSSPDSSPTTKLLQQQQRSVSFAESTDDEAPLPRGGSSNDRPSSTGSSSSAAQGDGQQAVPLHANTSRGKLLKECTGLRNQLREAASIIYAAQVCARI